MKKTLIAAFAVLLSVSTVFANGSKEEKSATQAQGPVTLKVGATPEPHAALLNLVVDDLAKQDINLQVVEFTDYVTPNEALENGELDANYFQHIPYLDSFNKERGYHLVNAGGIHVEPFALYSKKYKSLADIPSGATVAIPNDPTNEGRGLLLLQAAGLLKLNDNAGLEATPVDVKENPKNLKFQEVEAAQVPRTLDDVDIAIINSNFAMQVPLDPTKDSMFIEDSTSPYVNILAVREGDENRPEIQALIKALKSDTVKNFIKEKYKGAVVPAF